MSFGGADLGSAYARVSIDITQLARGVQAARVQFGLLATSGEAAGSALSKISTGSLVIGAGVAGALGAATKAFIDFEKSMGNVNSIVQTTAPALEELSQAVLDMAGETARAPKDLAEGLYQIVQSGFDAADSLIVLESAAKAANAGLTNTQVATKAIVSVLAAYKLGADQAKNVSDELFKVVDKGIVTFEDLASQIGGVLPEAQAAGIGLKEVGAALILLTRRGLSASEATTQISALIRKLVDPTEALAAAYKAAGIQSGEWLIETKGLVGALEFLESITGGSTAATSALLGEIRATRGAVALTTDDVREYNAALEDMNTATEGAGATADALAEQQKTTAFAIQQMKAELLVAAIIIGSSFAPAVADAAGFISDLAGAFAALNPETQTFVAQATLAVGAFALMTFGGIKLVAIAMGVISAWRGLITIIAASRLAMSAAFIALNPVTIGLGLLGFAAFKAIQSYRANQQAVEDLAAAYDELGDALNSAQLQGNVTLTENLTGIETQLADITRLTEGAGEAWVSWVEDGAVATDRFGNSVHQTDNELRNMHDTFTDGIASNEQLAEATQLATRAISTQGIDVGEVGGIINLAMQQYALFISSQGQLGISADALVEILRSLNENIGEHALVTSEATEATDELARAEDRAALHMEQQADAARLAAQALEERNKAIADAKTAAVEWVAQEQNIIPLLRDMGTEAGTAGHRILLLGEDIGRMQSQVSNLAAIVVTGTQNLGAVSQSVADFSQELIGAEGEARMLDTALNTGRITYDEYTAAIAANTRIQENNEAIQAHMAAIQAKQLPFLASYVDSYEDYLETLMNLPAAEQRQALAFGDTAERAKVAEQFSTAYAASLGQIPTEVATEMIANAAQADPVLREILEKYGLIEVGAEGEITVNFDQVESMTDSIGNITTAIENLNLILTAIARVWGIDVEFGGNVKEGTDDINDLNTAIGETATDTAIEVSVGVGDFDTSAVDDYQPPDIIVPVTLGTPAGASGENALGEGSGAPVQTVTMEIQADTTQFDASAADVSETMDELDGRSSKAMVNLDAGDAVIDIENVKALLDSIPSMVTTTFVFGTAGTGGDETGGGNSQGGVAGSMADIIYQLDTWETAVATTFTFTRDTLLLDTAENLEEWPATVATAFDFSVTDTGVDLMNQVTTWVDAFILHGQTLKTSYDFDMGPADSDQMNAVAAWADWMKNNAVTMSTVYTFISGDSMATIAALGVAFVLLKLVGDAYAAGDYTATAELDVGPANTNFDYIWERANNWGTTETTAAAFLDISAAQFGFDVLFSRGNEWANSGFTAFASIAVDTSGLANARFEAAYTAQYISDVMPHSPARKGPLRKVPNFDYIVKAMTESLSQLPRALNQSLEGLDFGGLDPMKAMRNTNSGNFLGARVGNFPAVFGSSGVAPVYNLTVDAPITGNIIGQGAEQWVGEAAARQIAPALIVAARRVERAQGGR